MPSCSRWIFACLFLATFLLVSCSDDAPPPRVRSAVPVRVAIAAPASMEDVIEAIGTARADESVQISAKVTEKVSKVHFDDGQVVKQGDLLVELTSVEESARLNEALAEMRERQRNFERVQRLFRQDTVSRSDLDQAESEMKTSRARVESMEAMLADRVVLAPFDGITGLRLVSPGSLVEPGDHITTLDDIDPIKADFTVPERFVGVLSVGQPVRAISAAYPGETFNGTVAVLPPRVDPDARAVTVRAHLPNPDGRLRPGMFLSMELVRTVREALTIPEGAIVPGGELAYVFLFRPDGDGTGLTQDAVNATGSVARTRVRLGLRQPGQVEVLEGLTPGDAVVVEGVNRVVDGASVRVLNVLPATGS